MANPPADTTEIVLRDGSKGLVTVDFARRFPALAPDEETLALLEENLGDEPLGIRNFKRVKVPAGGVRSWMIARGGTEVATKNLTGVMVAWSKRRSYWVNGDPDGSQPDCSSVDCRHPVPGGLYAPDGERGHLNPTGKCANCPMARNGSESTGRGQACHEQRLVFFLVEGALFPLIVQVPRTSIGNFTTHVLDLVEDGKRFYEVEISLGLDGTSNKVGQDYNEITIAVTRTLESGEVEAVKAYGDEIRELVAAANRMFDPSDVGADSEGVSVGSPTS